MISFKVLLFLFNLVIATSECFFEFVAHNFVNYNVRGNDYGLPYLAVHGKLRQFFPERFGLNENSDKFGDELLKLLRRDRNVYMLKLEDLLTKKFYWNFFKNLLKTNNNSLLLVLPRRDKVLYGKNKTCDEAHATDFANGKLPKCKNLDKLHQETLSNLENFLYKSKPKCSLSVTEFDETTENLLKQTRSTGGLLRDDLRVSTKGFQSTPVTNFLTINLYAELNTTPTNGSISDPREKVEDKTEHEPVKKKKLLLTTSLDTFGLLQTYSSTGNYNSGLVFLLELARLMKDVKSKVYDLIFLLYSGSAVEYSGLRHFLNNYKNIRDLEFVANFSDLSGEKLYLHYIHANHNHLDPFTKVLGSKLGVETTVKQVNNPYLERMKKDGTGKEQLGFDQPPGPEDLPELNLPNEVDFNANFNSFTLTSTLDPVPLYKRSYSLNFLFDVDLVSQRVVDAARALAQLMKAPPLEVNVEEVRENVRRWQERLKDPRNNLNTNLMLLDSVKEVLSHLEKHLGKVQVQNFRTNLTVHKFMTSAPNNCLVFVTKHPAFDIVVFAAVTLYILTVWSVMRGSVTVAVDDIVDLMQQVFNEKNFKFKTS